MPLLCSSGRDERIIETRLVSFDDYAYVDSAFFGMLDPAEYGSLAGDFDHDGDVDADD
jgi:hypothetical protein